MYPQEIEVWYILPLIRKELAKALLNYNLTQKEIASKLELTEAAVSQYLNEKRANLINLDNDIKQAIEKSAKKIATQNTNVIKEIQLISNLIWKNKTICKFHVRNDKSLKRTCDICFK
jgi:predicted transcriptional regulator